MSEDLIVCRTCGSLNHKEYFVAKDLNQDKTDESFKYNICNDCKSIFLDKVPSNLSFYYGSDYPAYSVVNSRNQENLLNSLEHAKLALVMNYVQTGKLVEIGPAAGRFLSVANGAGYDVLGIEQDAGCVEYIKENLNLKVKLSDNPAAELLSLASSCDVIVAWHVLEHIEDLKGFVAAASKALRGSAGIVILSAPNPAAWSFKIFGRYWMHLDAPRHLTLIPLDALDNLIAQNGMGRVSCIYDDKVGLVLNKMGWSGSLSNLKGNKKVYKLWLGRLGQILSIFMKVFDRIPGRGAAYTVTYKIINSDVLNGSFSETKSENIGIFKG